MLAGTGSLAEASSGSSSSSTPSISSGDTWCVWILNTKSGTKESFISKGAGARHIGASDSYFRPKKNKERIQRTVGTFGDYKWSLVGENCPSFKVDR